MKKIAHILILSLLSAVLFFSCGSTKEVVTSTIETDHMTVQQINTGIRLIAKKAASEDINYVEITDKENKCTAKVDLGTELSSSFLWPFVDGKREYTLTGKFFGNTGYFEESVTFTVENACVSLVPVSDVLKRSRLNLIADGDKRLIKTMAPTDEIIALTKDPILANSGIRIELYSGSRKSPEAAELILSITDDAVGKITDGYDILAYAEDYKYTKESLNEKLAAKETYYADAILDFKYPARDNVTYVIYVLSSNDTIYTPVKL